MEEKKGWRGFDFTSSTAASSRNKMLLSIEDAVLLCQANQPAASSWM